jgi:hypothetical protein
MARALVSGAVALIALAAVLALRSDSLGDGPSKATATPAESAAKPPAEAAPKQPSQPVGKTAVEQALGDTADFNFTNTPLKDIAAFVANRYKINLLLDSKALADAGVTGDSTFTEQVKGISLRSALRLILAPKDLDFIESDDNLLTITTLDVAKTRTTMRIYDVRNFADPVVEFSPGPVSWTRLSEIITSTVMPASWTANGGAATLTIADGNMVVLQAIEVQEQIADLLSQLETARRLVAGPPGGELPTTIETPNESKSRIDRALDSRQDFVFVDTPLSTIVQILEKKLGIAVQLDTKALADAGVIPETFLSIDLKQIRARVGLRALLATKDLNFIIDHEVLLITTSEVGKMKTVTKLYPVEDLVGALNPTTGEIDFQSLVETITGSVIPASWDANGGAGSIEPFRICKVLVVSQTMELHEDIKDLLTKLRAARKNNPPTVAAPSDAPIVRMYSLRLLADEKESQQIVDMIRKLVEPKSWNDSNVYIGLVSGSIVVRQTPEVHRHIQNLLNALGLTPGVGPSPMSDTSQRPVPLSRAGGGFGGGFGASGFGGGGGAF